MRTNHLFAGLVLASAAAAQSVQPPFNTYYQAVDLGQMPGIPTYGGTAFVPNDPNTLLVSAYLSNQIRAVPVQRDALGRIVGFGPSTLHATVGGNDGGLAFGPNDVLFFTWFGPNRLGEILPGHTTPDRIIDLQPLGVSSSVGSCAFVPAGRSGAGRFKLASYNSSTWYDVTLAPDGNGTFAVGAVSPAIHLQGGPEGMLYPPPGSPLLDQSVLVAEWSTSLVVAYATDANGDPVPASRQVVMTGVTSVGGGTVDPVTGDLLVTNGAGHLFALRQGGACGTITSYGQATPGGTVTPVLSGSGCARLGQTVALRVDGPVFGLGVLAVGSYPTNYTFLGLTVLTTSEVLATSVLDANGVMTLPIAIPTAANLGNAHVYFQAGYLDAGTASGLSATAGLDLWIR